MENVDRTNEVILLLDNYSEESRDLHTSFKLTGQDYLTIVIEEDGFFPEDVISVYSYFLGDFKNSNAVPGKPRYFNQIQIPEYWEISGNNTSGKIHDMDREKGRIFYAEPKHKRHVKVVDWLDDRGVVRSSDHYNRYGALYARTIFNEKGQRVNKTYFSVDGKETIVENFVTGDIVLNDGPTVNIFHSKTEITLYLLKKVMNPESRVFYNSLSTPFFVSQRLPQGAKRDILFWQEPKRDDIPGNMTIILNGQATRTEKIMVQRENAYNKLIELGASTTIVKKLGFVYPVERANMHRLEVLICTNSDQIENVRNLVEAFPEMQFHIAALTEMSSHLMSMDTYENVILYPGVKMSILDELFEECDFYLDINHGSEIVSAVKRAFMNNQLIFAFNETVHNRIYIADEHIYNAKDVNRLISEMRMIVMNPQLIEEHLHFQHQAALAENTDAYKL